MSDQTTDLTLDESSDNIVPINIEEEMRTAYIDYSMSVIVSRALPDVRDGLKPVHRRVLYAMDELGLSYNRPYKKSARIVGECLGKYHPHGDSSVYDAMVRMAQEWSLRYPLVDGQGNFGSIDGDSPAAMRYTEARLKRVADEMLSDLAKNTVEFRPNFDDSLEEPAVLPARLPNLLVNGSSGIAVGMATNMPPHNLREVVAGITAYIDNRDITTTELGEYIKGPDFPTGGTIYGTAGIRNSYEHGRGRIVIRANYKIETFDNGNRERIVFYDVPYQTNKATLIEKIAALVNARDPNDRVLEGISDLRDESDREGIRIVIDLKRDTYNQVVINNLYKYTGLQSTFGVNNVALVKSRPVTLSLKQLIEHFVEHRHEVVIRRTEFDLAEAEKRAHILEGLLIALDHLDEVIKLIRESRDPDAARTGLMSRFGLSERQANAILEMRLQRLTGLEREKIQQEYAEIMTRIADYKDILSSFERRMGIIKTELTDLADRYGDDRRTRIEFDTGDLEDEDLIEDEEMVITVSHMGYIKRTPLTEYRTQGRGGVGLKATGAREDDFTEHLFVASMHQYLLFFMESGKLYWKKVHRLPPGGRTSKGRPLQNELQELKPGDRVRAVLNVRTLSDPDYINNHYLVMGTAHGVIKKTTLEAFSRPRAAGIFAINIREGDRLLDVCLTDGNNEIIMAKRSGLAVRFHEDQVRPMGRTATGVRGVYLEDTTEDEVIGMVCVKDPGQNLMVISEKGYGKRSDINDYRLTNRGAKGVKTINVTEKTGRLVGILAVDDNSEMMIINRSGISIRMGMEDLRVMGRATQGVRLIRLNDGDEIMSVARIESQPKVDEADTHTAADALLLAEAEGAQAASQVSSASNEQNQDTDINEARPDLSKNDEGKPSGGALDA